MKRTPKTILDFGFKRKEKAAAPVPANLPAVDHPSPVDASSEFVSSDVPDESPGLSATQNNIVDADSTCSTNKLPSSSSSSEQRNSFFDNKESPLNHT